jgi:hypothetical protein
MPVATRPFEPAGFFRWDLTTPGTGRRAVSYYARWPSPTQGRAILLRSKALLPIAGFLETCAVLELIDEFREQPGVLTRTVAGTSTVYRPDFLFSRDGDTYLLFASSRSMAKAADLDRQLIAHCENTLCRFRVCRCLPPPSTSVALCALSPAQLKRGLPTPTERRLVTHLFAAWIDGH